MWKLERLTVVFLLSCHELAAAPWSWQPVEMMDGLEILSVGSFTLELVNRIDCLLLDKFLETA